MRDSNPPPSRPRVIPNVMRRVAAITAAMILGLATSCTGSEAAAPETASGATAGIEPEMAPKPVAAPAPETSPDPTAYQEIRFSYAGEMTQGGFIRGRVPKGTATASLGEQSLDVAEDGTFFAAFDRDSLADLPLTATLKNGQIVSETISISEREWNIQRVNVAKRPGGSSEAWWAKRKPEWEAINAARARQTSAAGWSQNFIWPVKGRISGLFGRQRIYRGEPGSYHSGIDIAPGNGVPFVAPADGVVVLARTGFSLEGGLIIIDHGAGLNSAFLHASRIVVKEGQAVRQGEHIGNVGATGRATGPHLHWGLKWKSARLDPLLFAGPMN